MIYGIATVTEGGAPELLRRLGHVYTGGEDPPSADPPPGYVVRVRVDGWQASVPGSAASPPASA